MKNELNEEFLKKTYLMKVRMKKFKIVFDNGIIFLMTIILVLPFIGCNRVSNNEPTKEQLEGALSSINQAYIGFTQSNLTGLRDDLNFLIFYLERGNENNLKDQIYYLGKIEGTLSSFGTSGTALQGIYYTEGSEEYKRFIKPFPELPFITTSFDLSRALEGQAQNISLLKDTLIKNGKLTSNGKTYLTNFKNLLDWLISSTENLEDVQFKDTEELLNKQLDAVKEATEKINALTL